MITVDLQSSDITPPSKVTLHSLIIHCFILLPPPIIISPVTSSLPAVSPLPPQSSYLSKLHQSLTCGLHTVTEYLYYTFPHNTPSKSFVLQPPNIPVPSFVHLEFSIFQNNFLLPLRFFFLPKCAWNSSLI